MLLARLLVPCFWFNSYLESGVFVEGAKKSCLQASTRLVGQHKAVGPRLSGMGDPEQTELVLLNRGTSFGQHDASMRVHVVTALRKLALSSHIQQQRVNVSMCPAGPSSLC